MGRRKVKNNKKRRKNIVQQINFDDSSNLPDQTKNEFQSSPATTASTPPEIGGQEYVQTQDFQAQVNQYIYQIAKNCNHDSINQESSYADRNLIVAKQYKEEIFDLIQKIYMDCLGDLKRIDSGEENTSDFEVNENVLAQIMLIQKCYSIKQFLIDLTYLAQQFVQVSFNFRKSLTEPWKQQRKAFKIEKVQALLKSILLTIQHQHVLLNTDTNLHCKQ